MTNPRVPTAPEAEADAERAALRIGAERLARGEIGIEEWMALGRSAARHGFGPGIA